MLAINVTIDGDKIAIAGLQQFADTMPGAVRRGLQRVTRGTHRNAMDFLNGPGRTPMRLTNRGAVIHEDGRITNQKSRLRGQSDDLGGRPGSYPVPVVTGNLKRLLDFLDPGQSKGDFVTGPFDALVYNSAEYASVIRDGTHSSSAYGRRDFLGDALDRFNQDDGIARTIDDEMQIEITKRGIA